VIFVVDVRFLELGIQYFTVQNH